MANTEFLQLFKYEEIRKVLSDPRQKVFHHVHCLNPLSNVRQLLNLNSYAEILRCPAGMVAEKLTVAKILAKTKKNKI